MLCRSHKLSNAAQRFSAKLAPRFEGPFEIVKQLSDSVYKLANQNNRRVAKVHSSNLMRYIPPRSSKENV